MEDTCSLLVVEVVTEGAVGALMEGGVMFGKENCECEAGVANKLLISIEPPNPDSKGDNAAPAPAAPKAAMAKAAY